VNRVDVLDEFWRLFNERRLDDAIELCTDDFEYIDNQNFGDSLNAQGFLAAMGQVLQAAPDRQVTTDRRFSDGGGSGVLVTTWRGTFTGAEAPTITGLVVVFDSREGRIVRQRAYYG
jgi:hypothetical protein